MGPQLPPVLQAVLGCGGGAGVVSMDKNNGYRYAKIQITDKKNNTIAMGKVKSQAFKV